ncbi:hypothetical protein DRQ36_11400, partial [bacterium]
MKNRGCKLYIIHFTLYIALALVSSAFGFDCQPIDVARTTEISPGGVVVSPDSIILNISAPRPIIIFDLPDGFLDEDNLIMEALLTIKITPDISWDRETPIAAYCLPITSAVDASPTWASLQSAYNMEYGEFGIYDPDDGTIFFEISRMLYAA